MSRATSTKIRLGDFITKFTVAEKRLALPQLVPIIYFTLYYLPFFFPETSYIQVHDVFDGQLTEDRAAIAFFREGKSVAEGLMGGSTPIWAMSRILQPLTIIPNLLLPVLPAFLLIDFIVRLSAYLAARAVGNGMGITNTGSYVFAVALSANLSYTTLGFGFAGFVILWAMSLDRFPSRARGNFFNLILVFVGWNTHLPAHGIFIASGFLLVSLVLQTEISLKKAATRTLSYVLGLLIGNANILYAQFASGILWHRAEFACTGCSLQQSTLEAITSSGLLSPFFPAHMYQFLIPLTALVVLSFLLAISSRAEGADMRRITIALILGVVLPFSAPFVRLLTNLESLSFLPSFQFDRLSIWGQLFFTVAIALAFKHVTSAKWRALAAICLVAQMSLTAVQTPHLRATYNSLIPISSLKVPQLEQNYYEYSRSRDYTAIREIIGEDLTMAIGLDPAPGILSGLHSANGYLTMYPLEYKHLFGKVIAQVIEGTEQEEYFWSWGSRVYSFANESNYRLLNFCEASKLGVKYSISGFELEEPQHEMIWHSDDKSIYLYKLSSPCA